MNELINTLNPCISIILSPIAKSSKTCLHQEEIKSYEAVFERLKQYAGEANLDRLVHEFLAKEGIAFALFNYKTELDCDVEAHTLRNQTLRKDMKLLTDQGIKLEGMRANIMKDLEVIQDRLFQASYFCYT